MIAEILHLAEQPVELRRLLHARDLQRHMRPEAGRLGRLHLRGLALRVCGNRHHESRTRVAARTKFGQEGAYNVQGCNAPKQWR